ncbi:MAG: NAD(P)H-dependent oxidoreductase subunit E [Deltaproteobacteria bacterium]|nr:NAD(P)H-dependent oxidoreductase subunit E [Deltaproteobacteria bacterium]
MQRISSYEDFLKLKNRVQSIMASSERIISVCGGGGCSSKDGKKIASALKDELGKKGLEEKIKVKLTGCHGMCSWGPSIIIYPEEICYLKVKEKDATEIIEETILRNRIVDRLVYEDEKVGKTPHLKDIPFYNRQTRLILGYNTKIDPQSIDDYIALGGYSALVKALTQMSPTDVLEEIKKSNLRGRGGGGFPAGQKWETTRNAKSDIKYVIVNGHEGEPGAYMDRAILGGNPHIVLEGLIIGAYAIGARQGFIYTRHDAPDLLKNIETAISKAREYGFIGKNILGSGFDFDVEIHLDIGIFVSGESSALMRSIEGKIPEPRPKYIRTSVSGIYEKPSNLNNVETWANVPLIIENGAEWYSKIGTERSKGTKLISLSGRIKNAGVIEVPFGMSLREIVFDLGGGTGNGNDLKAVHFGSAMGGSIPKELIDTPLDFDACAKLGAPIGAGGLLVLDEKDDMLELVSYFLDFLSTESCGKCVPCREGIRQIRKLLKKIKDGSGTYQDVETIREICDVQKEASLCALGRTASSPLESALKYFWKEFESRLVKEK